MPDLAHNVYTEDPGAGPYVVFPNHAYQILSNCIHILGASILAFCFARRTQTDCFLSRLWWSNVTWARLLVIFIFVDSWFFLAATGVLINGVGLSFTTAVCSLAVYTCIVFYVGSKALIYLFLVERVWIVCSAGKSLTRLQSRVYKSCVLICLGYVGIVVNGVFGHYTEIRPDGVCIIGLASSASIPAIIYDLVINLSLTLMFVWTLRREENISARLRRLARRTAIASTIALSTSFVNLLALVLLDGRQLGWVCLGACASDVTVNALVIFWVTTSTPRDPGWNCGGLFPWEPKDAYNDPLDLPPLNFPVSFAADPERGSSPDTQNEEAGEASAHAVGVSSPKSLNVHLVNLVGSMSPRSRRDAQSGTKFAEVLVKDTNGVYAENSTDDEWDIAESSSVGHERALSLLMLDVNPDFEPGPAGEQLPSSSVRGTDSSTTHETDESRAQLVVDTRPLVPLHQPVPVSPPHTDRSSSSPLSTHLSHHSEPRTSVRARFDLGEGPSSGHGGRRSGASIKRSREGGEGEEREGSGGGTLWRTVDAALGLARTHSVQATASECDGRMRLPGSKVVKKAKLEPFVGESFPAESRDAPSY